MRIRKRYAQTLGLGLEKEQVVVQGTIKYERYKSFGTDAKDVRTVRIVQVVRYSTTRTDVSNKSYVTVQEV